MAIRTKQIHVDILQQSLDGNRKFLINEMQPSRRLGKDIYIRLKEYEVEETNLLYPGNTVEIFETRFRNGRCRHSVALNENGVTEIEKAVIDNVRLSEIWPHKSMTGGTRVTVDLHKNGE